MSDDEADQELLELLRQSLGLSNRPQDEISSDTGMSPFYICIIMNPQRAILLHKHQYLYGDGTYWAQTSRNVSII